MINYIFDSIIKNSKVNNIIQCFLKNYCNSSFSWQQKSWFIYEQYVLEYYAICKIYVEFRYWNIISINYYLNQSK